jgi:VWFA-related protein
MFGNWSSRMAKRYALLLVLAALPAFAVTPVTVGQLEQVLQVAHGQSDAKLNKQLSNLELTERLNPSLRSQWEAELPGPASRQTLLVLADASAFLEPPTGELPAMPPPTLATQRQIIARSADFARKTISKLPDFYATRDTLRFENAPAPAREPQPMHSVDTSRDTILYRDGREVVSLSAAERKHYGLATPGLETNGVFGPMLGSVLTDAAQGKLAWSHWEKGPQGPLAVFSYKIPQAKSHYRVELGMEYRDHPAYHGEFAVDPGTGTILRLTIEADLEKTSPVTKAGVLVEYSPVTIAGKTYICPLKSVTINVFYPACATTEIGACGALAYVRGFKTQASLNDVTFSQYHVFRADTRILVAGSLPPKDEVNAEPVAPNAGNGSGQAERGEKVTMAQRATTGIPLFAPSDSPALSGMESLAKASIKPADVSSLPAIAAPPHSTPADASTPVFHVTPGIVYLDLVVRDRNNHVVNGLTQNDFRISENGHAQTIDSFRAVTQSSPDHSSLGGPQATAGPNASAAGGPPGTINIILFDLLDTSPVNQAYARTQMLKFLEALPPDQEIGLYILTGSRLRMVQNITGSSALLAEAARQLLPQSSLLFQSAAAQRHSNDVTGSMPGPATPSGTDNSIILDLANELASENFQHDQVRNEFVAKAFRALAKSLESFSGRKNLFWLAGSFPLSARSEMLTASRIAVYPISVLGIEADSIDAEMNGNGVTTGAAGLGAGGLEAQGNDRSSSRENLRGSAEQIAAQTGGEAFVGVNDLARALRQSLEAGDNYYSLVYSPTDRNWDGKFRRIHVELARKGYTLSYRQGYFALPVSLSGSIPKP